MKTVRQQNVGGPKLVKYAFYLYITGASHHSTVAVKNIKAFCERYVPNRYSLDIIDVYQQPALAETQQIIAAPTLVVKAPGMVRRIIGDLSNTEKILITLGLEVPLE
jgi:circadian clock protein KaiB